MSQRNPSGEHISEHITYEEAIHSETATERHINNTPSESIIATMKLTAEKVFEPLRKRVGELRGQDSPITINSFYRSPELNKAIGGAQDSQHTRGEAIDLNVNYSDFNKKDLFELIRKEFDFDQLIYEGGTPDNPAWVHVSYSNTHNRKQVLKMVYRNGKPTYELI